MWVVKLGGSLLGTPELQSWLNVIARHGDGRVVIVPGGGVYADAVREAQRRADFSDIAAHRMALLAMEQYAFTLQALQPALVTAASELEISERSWQHRGIVWLPARMVLAEDDIPQSWEVTSDSLAAWLARKLSASRLILVKHETVRPDMPIDQLAAAGILDPAFCRFAQGLEDRIHVIGKAGFDIFEKMLTERPLPTRAI